MATTSVIPGKSRESRLIQMLEGTTGPRMPFGGDPLPAGTIALFKTWIQARAKGPDVGATTPSHLPAVPIPDIKPRGSAVSPVGAVAFLRTGSCWRWAGTKNRVATGMVFLNVAFP